MQTSGKKPPARPPKEVFLIRSETPQIERFREVARELGCDDNEDRFKDALRKIAKAPPAKNGGPARNPKGGKA